MNISKKEKELKDCIISLIRDYNGTWANLQKEKRYKDLIKNFNK